MIGFAGRWTPADRAQSVWHYLSFEVPLECSGLRIQPAYDRAAGVLDFGVIDPDGWRGWSGGARDLIEFGRDTNTPGYVVRGLPPGEWQVVVGLHRLPAEGIEYRVEIEFGAVDVPPLPRSTPVARPPQRAIPSVDGLHWLAGDLHAHTLHSDGALPIDAVAAMAVGAGLDFLAVTDHNTVSHHPFLAEVGARHGIDLLPGQEVTTADGHANAFGDIGWVDFRKPADHWVSEVARRGGLLSINHPVSGDCAWRHPLVAQPPLAEVWHWPWSDPTDGGPLAWWTAAGHPIPIGGSDWHHAQGTAAIGNPTTWVACADGDVLGGMAAGRTAISAGRAGPLLVRVGGELVAIDADAAMLVCMDGRRTPVHSELATFAGHAGPHLLEADDRGVLAIAN